jgi:hypothetical protein
VYVLSSRKDSNKQQVPKEGKCTIDTGNQQGNIVSREFVLNVLELSEANFQPLTKEEAKGATGITDDKFIPVAAIYLTWYHKKSTRVFRSMRFLISPYQHYDLIIGARSIREHNLLDVPNLMAGPLGRSAVNSGKPKDSVRAALEKTVHDSRDHVNSLVEQKEEEARNKEDTATTEKELVAAKQTLAAAEKALDDYNTSVNSQNLRKALTAKKDVPATGESSQSTGSDDKAGSAKPKKKGSWSLRQRGPQAPPVG